ncbi:hypothetical protein B0T21DRAFT_412287 [Apiosordaria backusii]|uniref:Uncharacterized protein n=1 Tax=Apiosordaria backusii TaxID=314023 RepID=A0AA40EBS3_9PEZI|nr:hypothetical protein B0T21DRAFT_412287 [Apiosordaria backusii]
MQVVRASPRNSSRSRRFTIAALSSQRTMANSTTVVGPLLSPRGKEDNVLIVPEPPPPPPPPSIPSHRVEKVAPSPHPEITRRRPLRSTTVLTEYTTITTTPIVVVEFDEGPITTEIPDSPPPPEPSEQRLEHSENSTTTPEGTPLNSTKPATLLTRTRLAGAAEPTPTSGVMGDVPYAPPPEPTASSTVDAPRYPGTGALITGDCASAQFTLIDDGGPTMVYAPFVGCINDKPDCCPFTPLATARKVKAVVVASPGVFPTPQNREDVSTKNCASDYYSVSGGCCPSGFTPWTSSMGGQTPCVSPLAATTEPPPITNAPAATTKLTMAMTGVVFAMQYPLQESSGGLTGGAIAGIVVGIILGVFLLASLIFFLCRCRRRKQLASFKKELHQNIYGDNGTGTSEVPTLVNNTSANSIRGSTTTTMTHNRQQTSLYGGTQYLHHSTINRDSAASVGHKEQRDSSRIDSPSEPYTPDSAYPQRLQTRDSMVRRESAHTLASELSFPDDDFYDIIPPTPGTPGTLADGNHNHNVRSNNNLLASHDGVVSGSELQLAKPQRLSRGYPRIVYTHSHGHGSSTSVPATENGGSSSGIISGGDNSGVGRPSTSTSGSVVSGPGSVCSRPPTRLEVMPGTPEEDNRENGEVEREKKIGAAAS